MKRQSTIQFPVSHPGQPVRRLPQNSAFSLIELMTAFSVLAVLMVILVGALEPVSKTWTESERRVQTYQRARGALELMARELTPAVVDTRMQFVVAPGEMLTEAGALNVVPDSPALFWMAPLGKNGDLRCVGYYLFRDDEKGFFRLKRIFVRPKNPEGYFPPMVNLENARDLKMRTSPTSADWFLDQWDEEAFNEEDAYNEHAIVSTVSDGVLAFWVQCYDLLGNPIPWLSESKVHPRRDLMFNSAAFFQQATTEPFENGKTMIYLAMTEFSMKANRLPAELEITLLTVDDDSLVRGREIPMVENHLNEGGALDLEKTVESYQDLLKASGINRVKTFSTRVKLVGGS